MALVHWRKLLSSLVIRVDADNKTTVALINNQGTVRSTQLHQLTVDLLTWCQLRGIHLRAFYIPGSLNVLADRPSRPDQVIATEWSLAKNIVHQMFLSWGRPHIDLFATRGNYKLPTYVSPVMDPQAFATDALSVDWRGMSAYAFPPPALLHKVVEKLLHTPTCQLILVTPYWPRLLWFPHVVGIAQGPPWEIPCDPNPLSQVLGNGRKVYHPNPQVLRLYAWLISKRV